MEENPDIDIVGAGYRIQRVNETRVVNWTYREVRNHEFLKFNMLLKDQFGHSTVMLRWETVQEYFHYPNTTSGIDYRIFLRLFFPESYGLPPNNVRFALLPDIVMQYHKHNDSITSRKQLDEIEIIK